MAKLTGTGVSGSDIFCTARVKSYPGGRCEALVCDKAIFGGSGWEARQGARVKESRAKEGGHDVARAVRRARAQVRDIALCTPFRWFVTLTLDPARVNRYDVREVTRHLNHWLDNQVRRKGLAYVLVPERHKDGAIHFHGFFNDALEARDSGTVSLPGQKAPQEAQERPPAGQMAGGRGETRLQPSRLVLGLHDGHRAVRRVRPGRQLRLQVHRQGAGPVTKW